MTGCSPRFPRVLVVGQDFDESTGGGITMSCLFRAWPRERLAVAGGERSLGASGFAGSYYRLGALEDRWAGPLARIPREAWNVSGPVQPGAGPQAAGSGSRTVADGAGTRGATPVASPTRALLRRGMYGALRVSGANDLLRGLHLSEQFLAWVHDFGPDLIYSQLASLRLVRLVGQLGRVTGTPLVVHFMDDWPTTLYRGGVWGPSIRRTLDRELRELLDRAALRLVISSDMAEEFAARYGHAFLPFHNALDLDDWAATRRSSWAPGVPFEILYAGRIGIANEDSLLDLARATEGLAGAARPAAPAGAPAVRLRVLTPDGEAPAAQYLRAFAHVDLLPPIPHADMPARLAQADLLVLPLDFGARAQDFARFSMPTKTVEYMASGTPAVVYAPAGNAVARYAAAEGWARVVGERDPAALTAALRALVADRDAREHLARRALDEAAARHDAGPARAAFRAALEAAATGSAVRGHAEGAGTAAP